MAKEILLWDDPKYMKNKNGNQDLERYLANPTLNSRDKFKKLNIKIEDIKQSLFNLNQKNPEYQKELPSGLDNETGFVLKHQLDAFYNGYSDASPDKVMGIDNIKRLQNATTKETIAKLIKEHDIKGNLNNVKTTNEDNIISLSRMGLLELNENGKRLSPKNTKKTVSDNVASAFKAKLENDPTYIASQKAKEKADDKHSEENAGNKSTLADEIREMNAKIIADTNAYYATHGRSSIPSYATSTSENKGQKEASNAPKKSAANASANKESNTKKTGKEQNTKASSSAQGTNKEKNGKNTKSTSTKASKGVSDDKKSQNPAENTQTGNTNTQQIDGIQNVSQDSNLVNQYQPQVPDAGMQQNSITPDLSSSYQDTGTSYNGGGGSSAGSSSVNNSQPVQQNAKPKFYSGSTVINGANLKLEFELGKAKWKAGYGPESGRAAGKKEEESLRNQIKSKYENMQASNGKNPRQYWIEQYKKAISDGMKKPASSDREARINALNEGIRAAEAAMKVKGEAKIQNVDSMYPVANGATTDLKGRRMDKYVQNPSTADDYKHNQRVANLKYKEAYEQGEKYNKLMKKADEIMSSSETTTKQTSTGLQSSTTFKVYSAKDLSWATTVKEEKKKYDKQRKYWSDEAKKWGNLAETAEGKETARSGKGVAR